MVASASAPAGTVPATRAGARPEITAAMSREKATALAYRSSRSLASPVRITASIAGVIAGLKCEGAGGVSRTCW